MLFLVVVSLSSARHVASWREQFGPKCVWKPLKTPYIYIICVCVFESSKFSSSLEALIAPKWRIGAAGPRYASPAREVRGPDLVLGQGQQTASCLVGHWWAMGHRWAMGHPSPKSRDVKGLREHLQTSGDHSQTIQSRKQPFQSVAASGLYLVQTNHLKIFEAQKVVYSDNVFQRLTVPGSEWVMCEVHWSTWIYDNFFGDWLTTYVSGHIPVAFNLYVSIQSMPVTFNLYVSIQSMPVLWPLPNAFGNLLLKKRSCVPVESLKEVEVLLQVPATTNSMLRPLPPVPLHLSASLLLLKASPKT